MNHPRGKSQTPVQSYVPPGYQAQPPAPDDMAPVGLYLSIAGLFCGCIGCVLPAAGLAISLWELRRPPRGLPLLGAILGLIGLTLWFSILSPILMTIAGALGLSTKSMAQQQTDYSINAAHQAIIDYREEEAAWPDDKKGADLIDGQLDGWNRPLRYKSLTDSFEIRSAGPDGKFDTEDDLTDDYIADETDFFDDENAAGGKGASKGDGGGDGDSTDPAGDSASDSTKDAASGKAKPNPPGAGPPAVKPGAGRRPLPPRSNRRTPADRMFDGRNLPTPP